MADIAGSQVIERGCLAPGFFAFCGLFAVEGSRFLQALRPREYKEILLAVI